MKTFFRSLSVILTAVCSFMGSTAMAVDTFDVTSSRLTLGAVQLGDTNYADVVATVNAYTVLGVDGGDTNGIGSFDPSSGTLRLSGVYVQGSYYQNARVVISNYTLQSVGVGCPVPMMANASGICISPSTTIVPSWDSTAKTWTTPALTELNRLRRFSGVRPMMLNEQVTEAAQNHADNMAKNLYLGHEETPGLPGFTGVTLKDRLATVGYSSYVEGEDGYQTNENQTPGEDNPVLTIRSLFMLPYHALALLNGHHDFGMGVSKNGANSFSSIDFASKTLADHSVIPAGEIRMWPCNGVSDILSKSLREEGPNPIPGRNLRTNPIGTPTYVIARSGNKLDITSYEVRSAGGTSVAIAKVLGKDVADLLGANPSQMAIIPNNPLELSTTYTSTVTGTNNGVPFTKTCQFTTGTM
jgi:uncharacterized protein YkwD